MLADLGLGKTNLSRKGDADRALRDLSWSWGLRRFKDPFFALDFLLVLDLDRRESREGLADCARDGRSSGSRGDLFFLRRRDRLLLMLVLI